MNDLTLFFISLMLFVSCVPKKMVNERVITVKDSTAVWELKDSLKIEDEQLWVLASEVTRNKESETNLESETLKKEIYYDTKAPIDSVSGKYPIKSEITTTNNIVLNKYIKDYEMQIHRDSIEKAKLITMNNNLELAVERMIDENKYIKYEPVKRLSLLYVLIVMGLVLCLMGFEYHNS